VTRYSKGFPIREWRKRSGTRNEPLDCRVYAYAALCSFGTIRWNRLKKPEHEPDVPVAAEPLPPEMVPPAGESTSIRRGAALLRTGDRPWQFNLA